MLNDQILKKIILPAAALAVLALPAVAKTMKAEFTGVVSSVNEYGRSAFWGEEPANVGDAVTLTYLYDPELANPEYVSEGRGNAYVYGGSTFGVGNVSPITSASIKLAARTYEFDPIYYGYLQFGGSEAADGRHYTSFYFDARTSDGVVDDDLDPFDVLFINVGVNSSTPSPFLFPSLVGSYTLDLTDSDEAGVYSNASFSSYFSDGEGPALWNISMGFDLSYVTISPYTTDPIDPGPSPVPLPAGAPLLLAGLGTLVCTRRMGRG